MHRGDVRALLILTYRSSFRRRVGRRRLASVDRSERDTIVGCSTDEPTARRRRSTKSCAERNVPVASEHRIVSNRWKSSVEQQQRIRVLSHSNFQGLRIDDIDSIGHTAPNRSSDARHAPY